jgi:hypothetical protein
MSKSKFMPSSADVGQPLKIAVGTAEAARRISVSIKTLYRLRDRGLLHPSVATRHLLWSVTELEAFIPSTQA